METLRSNASRQCAKWGRAGEGGVRAKACVTAREMAAAEAKNGIRRAGPMPIRGDVTL